jgi:uncharacterized membrane protein
VKIIGIKARDVEHGEFVVEALKTAVKNKRVTLEDIAMVTMDDQGKIRIHQTKDATAKKGAGKGALVGALVGLAAPPLLGAAVLGAGLGAVWGKFRDRGIDDDLMRSVGNMIGSGEAVVFAMGDDASIDAVGEKVRELTDGEMETYTVKADDEALVREASVDIPEPGVRTQQVPLS